MSIMQNKVSRRIVLGSIAGGLAGTATVLQVLKGKYRTELTSGKHSGDQAVMHKPHKYVKDPNYVADWDTYVKMLNVPVKVIDGPSTFTLDYKLQAGKAFRLVSLDAMYDRYSYPAEYPQAPFWYTITDGRVAATQPIEDSRPALLVSADQTLVKARTVREDHRKDPGGKCVVVPMNGDAHYYEMVDGTAKRLSTSAINATCLRLAASIMLSYPKGKMLAKGMKWTIPNMSSFGVEIPVEVAGFAQVAEHETVMFHSDRRLTKEEFQQSMMREIRQVAIADKKRDSKLDVDKIVKDRLKQVTEQESTQGFQFTWYIDLKSGIMVRRDLTTTTYNPKPPHSDVISKVISQVFES